MSPLEHEIPTSGLSIPRVVSIGNGKGGTGKTSVSANVAGLAASNGFRTLLIDFDPQANLRHDLGYLAPEDGGLALRRALEEGDPLPVSLDVRPNLDVVKGGPRVTEILGVLFQRGPGAATLATLLYRSLSAVAGPYDLILIDTPPGDALFVEAAFSVSTAVVITTASDQASIDGVEVTAERFLSVLKHTNPVLELAGVVLFGIGTQSRRIERRAREAMAKKLEGTESPVFRARIRHAEGAASDARDRGLLIHELEPLVTKAYKERFAALREGRPADPGQLHSSNVDGVAGDYASLTAEILDRVMEIETEQEASK